MPIAVRVEPTEVTVDPGSTAALTVHVVNLGGVVDRVGLSVLGEAAAWCRVEPADVGLFPGQDGVATLLVTPPRGARLGPVDLGIKGVAETSGDVEVGEGTVNVGAAVGVEAELRPRMARGRRRATSVAVLTNTGNAPVRVQVVPFDADEAIIFERPAPADVRPGETVELPIRMKLPPRDVGGGTLPYQVLIEGAGDLARPLDGSVRQPRKQRWPLLLVAAAVGLVLLAFTQLKQEDSQAIRTGSEDVIPTTTLPITVPSVPGAPTTLPPGVTTPAINGGPASVPGVPTTKAPADATATTRAATVQPVAPTTSQAPVSAVRPTNSQPVATAPPAAADPKTAVAKLLDFWSRGDQSAALTVASDAVVKDLFSRAKPSGQTGGNVTGVQQAGSSATLALTCTPAPNPGTGLTGAGATLVGNTWKVTSVSPDGRCSA